VNSGTEESQHKLLHPNISLLFSQSNKMKKRALFFSSSCLQRREREREKEIVPAIVIKEKSVQLSPPSRLFSSCSCREREMILCSSLL